MRGFLQAAFWSGLLSTVLGALWYLGLQPEASRAPAIVIVPQLILAELLGGIGFLTATVAAAALLITDRLAAQQSALDRIARQTEPPLAPMGQINRPMPAAPQPASPSPRAPNDPPRFTGTISGPLRRHTPFGMKACPSCGENNWHDARTCSRCGTTFAMATQS